MQRDAKDAKEAVKHPMLAIRLSEMDNAIDKLSTIVDTLGCRLGPLMVEREEVLAKQVHTPCPSMSEVSYRVMAMEERVKRITDELSAIYEALEV